MQSHSQLIPSYKQGGDLYPVSASIIDSTFLEEHLHNTIETEITRLLTKSEKENSLSGLQNPTWWISHVFAPSINQTTTPHTEIIDILYPCIIRLIEKRKITVPHKLSNIINHCIYEVRKADQVGRRALRVNNDLFAQSKLNKDDLLIAINKLRHSIDTNIQFSLAKILEKTEEYANNGSISIAKRIELNKFWGLATNEIKINQYVGTAQESLANTSMSQTAVSQVYRYTHLLLNLLEEETTRVFSVKKESNRLKDHLSKRISSLVDFNN